MAGALSLTPPARAHAVVVGHGSQARVELWVTTPDGLQLRWPLSELGTLRLAETSTSAAASLARRKASATG